jgi:hypothetical protein
MPYLNKNEVVAMLKAKQQTQIVNDHVLTGVPFVFQSNPPAYQNFVGTLSLQFRTPAADITVIGSARLGISLDPDKFGTPFSKTSDVDTIVVNAQMFDTAWFELYNLGRSKALLPVQVRNVYHEHKKNNVFYGYIEPGRLPGVVKLSPLWFRTLQGLGRIRELANHKVNGRLYRTWDHVRAHQHYSLEEIAIDLQTNIK